MPSKTKIHDDITIIISPKIYLIYITGSYWNFVIWKQSTSNYYLFSMKILYIEGGDYCSGRQYRNATFFFTGIGFVGNTQPSRIQFKLPSVCLEIASNLNLSWIALAEIGKIRLKFIADTT